MKSSELKFNRKGDFSEGLARVEIDGKWGFINEKGELVIPCECDEVGCFYEGYAKVMICEYGQIISHFSDFTKFVGYDVWWFIDKSGKIISSAYEEIESFSEGLAAVCRGGIWGFINERDKPVIPFEYDRADFFFEGLAAVQKDDKWGFIDKSNKLVIPYEYDSFCGFNRGLSIVLKDGKWGMIDKTGRAVIPIEYDSAGYRKDSLIEFRKGGKTYLVDETGKFIS